MTSQLLLIIGVCILGLLGFVHLIYTLFTNKFNARDADVTNAMKNVGPVISGDTSMWNAWIGFNLSHSIGVLIFSLIYIPLAVSNMPTIQNSLWLSLLPSLVGLSYLVLAKVYWFKTPFIGVSLATTFMVASFICIKLGF